MAKFEPSQDQIDLMREVDQTPSNATEDIAWYRSYPSAIAQGAIKGLTKVGEMISGPYESLPRPPSERMTAEQVDQSRERALNQILPLGNEAGPQIVKRAVQTGIESAPLAALGGNPASVIGRATAGGAGAEVAKQQGAPEWMQSAIEIGSQFAPGLSKKIPNVMPTQAGQAERQLMDDARRMGMSEDELALTLNQRGPVKDFLQNVAAKGGRTVTRFEKTKNALHRVWDTLRGTPEAQTSLNGVQSSQLVNNISSRISRLPSAQRDLISTDFNDLISSPMRGTDIMDFWQKVNYYISKGDRALGIVKEDLSKAMKDISPELGKDFEITNKLYGNFYKLAERMEPNIADTLFSKGEAGSILLGTMTGNFPLLKKALSLTGATQLATELTTNPRFMNLSSRLLSAVNQGMPQAAKKIYDQLLLEVGKKNAEAAMKMSQLDFDSFLEALPEEQKKK